jgi:hypothetical protein
MAVITEGSYLLIQLLKFVETVLKLAPVLYIFRRLSNRSSVFLKICHGV